MLDRPTAAIAANRFGLGARPGELAQIGSQPRDWLRAQLAGAPPLLTGGELHSSAERWPAAWKCGGSFAKRSVPPLRLNVQLKRTPSPQS